MITDYKLFGAFFLYWCYFVVAWIYNLTGGTIGLAPTPPKLCQHRISLIEFHARIFLRWLEDLRYRMAAGDSAYLPL